MEAFGIYLLKSVVWLTGFAIVFLTVLRNERFFRLNRIYLLSGIIASIAFPFYTWHYAVISPSEPTGNISISGLSAYVLDDSAPAVPVYWWFYAAGIGLLAFRLIWQTLRVIRKLRKTGYEVKGAVKLVRTSEYAASFSFFSFVFVNPSTSDVETNEIVNHESEHIQQRHWFDLLLVEILCLLQWFNPFVWIYARLIRQNHEYLADERALKFTSDPAIYQATLLNQLLGVPVISLANSFSYSLNQKRFKMMKKRIDSPYRKLKLLLILPLMALVFYAFAKPEYISPVSVSQTDKISLINENVDAESGIVKGKVVSADGNPLPGAAVVIKGTTIGTITDREGIFILKDVPKEGELVFSFGGMKKITVKPDLDKPMIVKMISQTVGVDEVVAVGYGTTAPPSPPGPATNHSGSKLSPLFVVDGTPVSETIFQAINSETIQSVKVLKGESATSKYGDRAKNGAVEVALKPNEKPFVFSDSLTRQRISIRTNPLNWDGSSKKTPLLILDGAVIDKAKMDAINPDMIESISVLKNKSATALYGDKAKDGVILIVSKKTGATDATLKKNLSDSDIPSELPPERANAMANAIKFRSVNSGNPPLVLVDGAIGKMNEVNPDRIESVRVLKGKEATDRYGDKAKNGVIEITLKKNLSELESTNSTANPTKIESVDPKHPPLYVVDGVITDARRAQYFLEVGVESVTSLKGKAATDKYGEKGTYGVVEMILKKNEAGDQKTEKTEFAGNPLNEEVDQPFVIVEKMPHFPGGEQTMMKFISDNVKYPPSAKKEGISGTVIVNFVVNRAGEITRQKVVRGIGGGCDEEALRIFTIMPKWNPGFQGGKAVNVSYTVPIRFEPDGDAKNNAAGLQKLDGKPYVVVEEMPQFPGGDKAMGKFLTENIKYPEQAKKDKAEGMVVVNFVIMRTGKIEKAKIKKGVRPDLDAEAMRIIGLMPDWKPGTQHGKTVDVAYTIPVQFVLRSLITEINFATR